MQKKPNYNFWRHFILLIGLLAIWLVLVVGLSLGSWLLTPQAERISYGVFINGINLSGLDRQQAKQKLADLPTIKPNENISLFYQSQAWATPAASLGKKPDIDKTLELAMSIGKSGRLDQQFRQRLVLFTKPINIQPIFSLDKNLVENWVANVAAQIDQDGVSPQAKIVGDGYELEAGQEGRTLNQVSMVETILSHPDQTSFELIIETTSPPLTDIDIELSKQRLDLLFAKKIFIYLSEDEKPLALTANDFFSWLKLPSGYQNSTIDQDLESWAVKYNRPAQNATFEFIDNKVTKFAPHRLGRSLDIQATRQKILTVLADLEDNSGLTETQTQAVFIQAEPAVTLAEVNPFGIKDRLGVGTSTYFGSIAGRVHNVGLTSNKLHGTLVAPGDEFSFNQTIGEVSAATGYQSAYVIKNGRTELGDGGGVCQVSTTIFRAVLNAGLPITAWRAHSYRVSYYEQNSKPGFDATVYEPSPDFKFKNDTGHHLLILSEADTTNRFLKVEIWGVDDGRQAITRNYSLYNQRPAPEPLYIPDPSLQPGATKQIDWAAPGATAKFDYLVTNKNGETIFEKTFVSNYQPWQAVYLVGE